MTEPGGPRPTLLVIDDDEVDRIALRRIARGHFDLREADTAQGGVDQLNLAPVDAVLLDYRLPDQDGLDLLPRLKNFDTPIIMLTGAGSEHTAVEALKRGAADYLAKKGLDTERLVGAVNEVLRTASLERELKEKQEELHAFSHTVAHDIKAPLRAISFFSSLAEKEAKGSVSAETEEHLKTVSDQSRKLMQLVDDLLTYTRIGRSAKTLEPVDLAPLMLDVQQRLATEISAHRASVALSTEFEGRGGPVVAGDATALAQLFQNLIANSVKFHQDRDPVVNVAATETDGFWKISVSDNGIGIAEEHLDAIFKPLRRLHAADEYEGTGIGLATCRRIVDQHRGRIWVDSTPGEGSTFHVTLKRADDANAT